MSRGMGMWDRGMVPFPESRQRDRAVPRAAGQELCHSQRCRTGQCPEVCGRRTVPFPEMQDRRTGQHPDVQDRQTELCPPAQTLRRPHSTCGTVPIPSPVTIASRTAPSRLPSPPVDADPRPASSRLVRPPPPIRRIPPARGQRAQQRWQRWPLIPGHASPGGTVAVTHSLIGDQCPRRTIRDKAEPPGANAGLHGCLVRHSAGLMNCPSILSAPLARAGLI